MIDFKQQCLCHLFVACLADTITHVQFVNLQSTVASEGHNKKLLLMYEQQNTPPPLSRGVRLTNLYSTMEVHSMVLWGEVPMLKVLGWHATTVLGGNVTNEETFAGQLKH